MRNIHPLYRQTTRCAGIFALLLVLLASSTGGQSKDLSDWQLIDADGLFTFQLPLGFVKTDMAGMESYLGEYFKGKTRFLFIWEATASNAYESRRESEMENYEESDTTIDNRRANIRTYSKLEDGQRKYRAELNVGDWEHNNVELYMEIESGDPSDLQLAKQIFKTIKFQKTK